MNTEDCQNQKPDPDYMAMLAEADNYLKVKPVDTPRTQYLVSKAKGGRSLREFGGAVNAVTFVSLMRIINGKHIELGQKTVKGYEQYIRKVIRRSSVAVLSMHIYYRTVEYGLGLDIIQIDGI